MTSKDGDERIHGGPAAAAAKRRRRFIAGAVCPSCGEMDRIVVETGESGSPVRRCVACGFSDALMPASGALPSTRFSRRPAPAGGAEKAREDAPSTVRIIEPRDPDST